MTAYRAPYLEAPHRKPVREWPMEVPFDGDPARNHERITATYEKLKQSEVPLLLLVATPGAIFKEETVKSLQADLPRMQTQHIGEGLHFIQESQPTNIGKAARAWIEALEPVEVPAVVADTRETP